MEHTNLRRFQSNICSRMSQAGDAQEGRQKYSLFFREISESSKSKSEKSGPRVIDNRPGSRLTGISRIFNCFVKYRLAISTGLRYMPSGVRRATRPQDFGLSRPSTRGATYHTHVGLYAGLHPRSGNYLYKKSVCPKYHPSFPSRQHHRRRHRAYIRNFSA